ncbi:MAG: hypothetical protein KDD43_16515, partial [Bdellovibrionales bacterium]|nr:hypothetical protein [Bdellovibrionales bacterium]
MNVEKLHEGAKAHYERLWKTVTRPEAQCLRWAVAGLLAWKDLGDPSPMHIHAGSASWRFAGDDDTEGPTHFTYLWDDDSALLGQLLGQGPEWHVWLCSPVYRVLV